MTDRYVNPTPRVVDPGAQRNFEALQGALNGFLQFFYAGDGAPTLTPPGVAWYVQRDGAAGSQLWVYDPIAPAWSAFA